MTSEAYVKALTPETAAALAAATLQSASRSEGAPLQAVAHSLAGAASTLTAHRGWMHRTSAAALAIAVAEVRFACLCPATAFPGTMTTPISPCKLESPGMHDQDEHRVTKAALILQGDMGNACSA